MGLKRRISTPVVPIHNEDTLGLGLSTDSAYSTISNSVPPPISRARATSTSLVVASSLTESTPTIPVATSLTRPMSPLAHTRPPKLNLPNPGISFTPPSPPEILPSQPPQSILKRAYDGLISLTQPHHTVPGRRGSDDETDSEKGLMDEDSDPTTATSSEDLNRKGGYWGIWASEETPADGYFSLPPSPPTRAADSFELQSLPTPALSAHSLSRRAASPIRTRIRDGWLRGVASKWVGGGGRGKTGMVMRELGWTLGMLILGFITSLGMALWLLKSLPM